jgi:hypothetical protein
MTKLTNREIANRMYPSHMTHQEAKEAAMQRMIERKPALKPNVLSDATRGCVSKLGGVAKPK